MLPENTGYTAMIGSQQGFSYAIVLAAVVIVGIVAEAAHLTTWRILQADREAELLYRGDAYRRAIQSYYDAGTPSKTYPRKLDDLFKDSRFANKRHIRGLYPDPMGEGEKKDWLLIRAPDGGISGVASTSKKEPLKKANFQKEFEKFEGAASYAQWLFEYVPETKPVLPQSGKGLPVGPPVRSIN